MSKTAQRVAAELRELAERLEKQVTINNRGGWSMNSNDLLTEAAFKLRQQARDLEDLR